MRKFDENSYLYLVDPIPIWKRKITPDEVGCTIQEFNSKLIKVAKEYYDDWALEVPDERHTVEKSNFSPEYYIELDKREIFAQVNYPAVGKWHAVSTNNFLNIDVEPVITLKNIILKDYHRTLTEYFQHEFDGIQYHNNHHTIDESWLQFYKNGDYKVQHNHLRYSANELQLKNMWAGGYYLADGKPDIRQPYSGRFGFNTRNRVSNQIVILFNGGVKETNIVQESKNLSIKFYEAQTFVKKIEEALKTKMIDISIDKRYLVSFDGTSEIIL